MVDHVEEQIRRAMEAGRFDHLPGKGKPLRLDDNPFEDPTWRAANRLLKSNGFTLPWIEKRQEIETELEVARSAVQRTWEWRQNAVGQNLHFNPAFVEAEWQQALEIFSQNLEAINRKIDDYNLRAPADVFRRGRLNVEKELDRFAPK